MAENNVNNSVKNDGFEKKYPARIIESGRVLLYRLSWNKKKHYVADGSFQVLVPVIFESKKVDVSEKQIDFVPVELEDKNKMDIRMDMVATIKVTDATKYYTKEVAKSTEEIDNMLINTFNSNLKDIITKYPYAYLIHQKFILPEGAVFPKRETYKEKIVNSDGTTEVVEKTRVVGMYTDPYIDPKTGNWKAIPHLKYDPLKDQKSDLSSPDYIDKLNEGFICDMAELKLTLDEFEKKYGVRIVSMECKSFKPASEKVQQMQDELQAEENRTKIEAERLKQARIKAEADMQLLKMYMDNLKERFPDISKEDALEMAKHYMYTNGSHGETSKESSAAVAGAVAGATSSQMKKRR